MDQSANTTHSSSDCEHGRGHFDGGKKGLACHRVQQQLANQSSDRTHEVKSEEDAEPVLCSSSIWWPKPELHDALPLKIPPQCDAHRGEQKGGIHALLNWIAFRPSLPFFLIRFERGARLSGRGRLGSWNVETQYSATRVSNAHLQSRADRTAMRRSIAKTWGNHKVGIAEALFLNGKALHLVPFVGHRMEVGDLPLNHQVVAFLVSRKRLRILTQNTHSGRAKPQHAKTAERKLGEASAVSPI